ncbi:MAG: enoyl-CoA hydratase/isomerase family protein [Candidatus Velthaea sp.]
MHDNETGDGAAPLRIERAGAVLRVTLERPRNANALDREIVDRLLDAIDDPAATGDLRALVLAGSGENFCGGFDLSNVESEDEAVVVLRFLRIETLLQRLYHAPFVTIACAHGTAVGAGADLFAACTYRIAEPEARFRMPGWQFGIALGTRRLCDRVGADVARDLLSANRTITGADAFASGLVTHLAERTAWPSVVDALVAATQTLAAPALAHLHDLSVADHRAADMAALVASALRSPGIKERILAYARARPARQREAP